MTADDGEAPVSPLARCDSFWVHGAGLAGDSWDRMTADLPLARTPDLPGHGQTAVMHPSRVERFAEVFADDVPQDAVLIGHSLGGMVALELTMRLKGKVAALVLIEAVPTVRDRFMGRISATLAAALFKAIPLSWFTRLSGVGQTPQTRAELHRQMPRMDKPRIVAALDAAAAYDGRAHLPQVSVPTLIIVGRKNKATHRGAALMAEQIPGAQMITLPGGHMLHTDNPTELRQAIDDFLTSISAGRG